MKGIDRLRKKAEGKGLNISDDALFVVTELRSTLYWLGGILVGMMIGFGIAILLSL